MKTVSVRCQPVCASFPGTLWMVLFLMLSSLFLARVASAQQTTNRTSGTQQTFVDVVSATDDVFENHVEISWTGDDTNVVELRLFRDDNDNGTFGSGERLAILPSATNVFSDFTGEPGRSYLYCVRANYTTGPDDTCTAARTDQGSRLIFAPTNFLATDGTFEDKVRLTWQDQSDIETGYDLYRDGSLLATLNSGTTNYNDETAVQGTEYIYCVEAFDTNGFTSTQACDAGERGFVLPPLDFTATDGQYTDRVVLTWTDQTDLEDGYEITRDGTILVAQTDPIVGPDTTYEDLGFTPGTTHEYCVTTISAGGQRSATICDDGTSGPASMAPPTNVVATDEEFDDRVDISWDDPGDAEDGFRIYRNGNLRDEVGAGIGSYSDDQGSPGTTRTYCIEAFSDLSGTSAQVCDDGTRSRVLAPTDVAATDGDFENITTISWQSTATQASLFKIYRDGSAIRTVPFSQLTYDDGGGTPGTTHTYCVSAMTSGGDESVALVCDDGSRVLLPPTTVAATGDEHEDRVRITWQDASQYETGYNVYRDGSLLTTTPLPANRTSYLDYGGVPGTTYSYEVVAFDALGDSAPGADDGSRRVLPPTNVAATDGTFEQQINLTWEDNSGIEDGYRIYRDGSQIHETAAGVRSYTDSGVSVGATHTYVIRAFDALGESADGTDDGFTTILPASSFNASESYTDRVVLTWVDDSAVETGYLIKRDGTTLTTTAADATMYTDNTAASGTTYTYCIESVGSGGNSEAVCDDGERSTSTTTTPPSNSFALDQKVFDPDGESEDGFGRGVAVDGDWAVIGAPNAGEDGIVYFYKRNSDGWEKTQHFAPSLPGDDARFGYDVAISGDYAAVGAWGHTPFPDEVARGRVYVYKRSGSTWALEADFTGETSGGARFGRSVDLQGDLLVVGSTEVGCNIPTVCAQGSDKGSVYVYRRSGTTWTQEHRLRPFDDAGNGNSIFGEDVGLDGDFIIVGDPDFSGAVRFGRTYIFQYDGNATWDGLQTIDTSDPYTELGYRVAIDMPHLITGQWAYNNNQGRVAVGAWNGSTFDISYFTASDVEDGDTFGSQVDLKGDFALISSQHDGDAAETAGAAYLYQYSNNAWTLRTKLYAADPEIGGENFSSELALSDTHVLIGDKDDINSSGDHQGAAYFMDLGLVDNVAASDGTYDNRIQVQWQDNWVAEEGFKVYRNGQLIETTAANATSYNDFDAQPGSTPEYCVIAFNSTFGESAPVCDIGWIPPDGAISGRIATASGVGVEDVNVCLAPTPDRALLFDGDGGHVKTDNFQFPGGNDLTAFTVEFWMRSNVDNDGAGFFSYSVGPGEGVFTREILLKGTALFQFRRENQFTNRALGMDDNSWHHVAVTWNSAGGTANIYKDGVLEKTATVNGAPLASGGILVLGQNQAAPGGPFEAGGAFEGLLDEVRFWDHVRTEAEIQASMNVGLTGAEEGLVGYWPLSEGQGTNTADRIAAPNHGTLGGGSYWSQESAPLDVCGISDDEGNYVLDGLRYGQQTNFSVTPSATGRAFSPAFKSITLSTGNPVQNEVGFTDITAFSVTGTVLFENTSCPVENVNINVDGTGGRTTDALGNFALAVDPGPHLFEPRLGDHLFDPAQTQATISGNLTGVDFFDTKTQRVSGRIGAGGPTCGATVGSLTLTFDAENQCMSEDATVSDGNYQVDLPPQKYFVTVTSNHPDPAQKNQIQTFFDNLGPQEVDLTDGDVADFDFIYHAPLLVTINGLPGSDLCDVSGAPQVPILQQGDQVPLNITVDENHGGTLCPVETGLVTIYDQIIDEENAPTELTIEDGAVSYVTAANTPNIFAGQVVNGVDRSYQKFITAAAEVEGQTTAQDTKWAYVQGHRPRPGTDFFSVSTSEIPLIILRDPPGDASNATLSQGETFCSVITNIFSESLAAGISTEIKTGVKFSKGFGFSTETEGEVTISGGLKIGFESTQANEFEVCTSTTEDYSTSGDESFISDDADVFVGAAMNYTFARTDVLDIERNGTMCTPVKSQAVTMGNDGFETTYAYTTQFIRDSLIPSLRDLGKQDEADNWQAHLDLNNTLKEIAVLKENRSFSAGADFTYTQTNSETSSFAWDFQVFAESERSVEFGFEESGSGASVGFSLDMGFSYTRAESNSTATERTISYTLADDDLGDNFTVDIKDDFAYGTPVFDLKAGTSSCPFEPTTIARDAPSIAINPIRIDNVPLGQPALFTLQLRNNSLEERTYVLQMNQASNGGGAIVSANGATLLTGQSFTLPAGGTQDVLMRVERGPVKYRYDNLEVALSSACDESISVSQIFHVNWETPCSDITLAAPAPGWPLNAASSTTPLPVTFNGFTLDASDTGKYVSSLGLQYRRKSTSGWENAFLVQRADVQTGRLPDSSYTKLDWFFPSSAPDGSYDLRAFTQCNGGQTYSEEVSGAVDRQLPEVFGTPLPADGTLNVGDNISITFDEPLACSSVDGDTPTGLRIPNVTLDHVIPGTPETFESLPINVACNGTSVILIPTDDVDLSALEGEVLQASVTTGRDNEGDLRPLTDLLGNPLGDTNNNPLTAPVEWRFTVQRSRLAWDPVTRAATLPYQQGGSVEADLVNGSAQNTDFSLNVVDNLGNSVPWLTPSSLTGSLIPSQQEAITFDISDALDADSTYEAIVHATSNPDVGSSDLHVSVSIICAPPEWNAPTGLPNTMPIIAEVFSPDDGGIPTISDQTSDRIAAFVGNQIRGVAQVQHEPANGGHEYLAFLNVSSNLERGETVSFKVWDASRCTIYESTEEYYGFDKDLVLGSLGNPVPLTAMESARQQVDLFAGWTWFSSNKAPSDASVGAVLSSVVPDNDDLVKSQIQFAQYAENNGWVGSLSMLVAGPSYRIKLLNPNALVLFGTPVDLPTHPLTLVSGWNWIGYLPQAAQPVNDALGDLDGTATTDDLIKSQFAFAQYLDGVGWIGSLSEMEPGRGYLLKTAAPGTLLYTEPPPPTQAIAATASTEPAQDTVDVTLVAGKTLISKAVSTMDRPDRQERALAKGTDTADNRPRSTSLQGGDNPGWRVDPAAFQFNMTMTATLEIAGTPVRHTDMLVGAFVDDEVRGLMAPQYVEALDAYLVFLLVHSNTASGESVTFRLYDVAADSTYEIADAVDFVSDAVLGSLQEPVVLAAGAETSTATEGLDLPIVFALNQNYPNPFNPATTIRYDLPTAERVVLTVFDVLGREVAVLVQADQPPGRYEVAFNAAHLASGVYFYRIEAGRELRTRRMMLLK